MSGVLSLEQLEQDSDSYLHNPDVLQLSRDVVWTIEHDEDEWDDDE
jgi:hypothetical protein